MSVVYDTILSAIHNSYELRFRDRSVVYDTILSAIHNHSFYAVPIPNVVYDTILSAIHNSPSSTAGMSKVVYDTILSAIHNFKGVPPTHEQLYMIRFCLYVKERRCKDTYYLWINKILLSSFSVTIVS